MTRQIRQLCWWPGISSYIRKFMETCLPCTAVVTRNSMPPMQKREMPERPWQHCSADYKGLIAGKYYFHVLIDNYSRWQEVVMVMSTSLQQLQGKLEDSFSIHRIPESITHDNAHVTTQQIGGHSVGNGDLRPGPSHQKTPKLME